MEKLSHAYIVSSASENARMGKAFYLAEKMLCQLEQRAARSGYQLHHTPRVGQALAAKARSAYGARELRRAVDRAVEQALADQIASGTACVGQHWTADCSADGAIVLREDETATL